MFYKEEIKDLFDLAWRVTTETKAFVSFDFQSHTKCCYISIIEKGWKKKRKADVTYYIYCGEEYLAKRSIEDLRKAKAHLLKLLIDGRCPLNVESDGIEASADNGDDNDSERTSGGAEQAESVHP